MRIIKKANIEDALREYNALREESKRIKARMDELATDIKSYAQKNGVKDDKGSFYMENDEFIYGSKAKKSISFNDEAIPFFKIHGFKDCIKTKFVEEVDEDAVETHLQDDSLSYDDLKKITDTKTTYAVDVKVKQELPEVEETKVTLAASRKPKRTRRTK